MHSTILVSIIIICRNELEHITRCIHAALAQKQSGFAIEVIVVDGMSTDGTYQLVQTHFGEKVVLLKNIEQFTPHGMNLGIKHANGTYIMVCGGRSIISANYAEACLTHLQSSSNIKCVGGLIQHVGTHEMSESIAVAMSTSSGVGLFNFRTITKSQMVDTVSVPVFPKKVFDELGLFDETCIRNQDDDFSYRIHKAGYSIWLTANAYSQYYVRSTIQQLFKQYYQYGFWKVYVNKKHKALTSSRQLFPPLFLVSLCISSLISLTYVAVILSIYLLFIFTTAITAGLYKKISIIILVWAIINMHIAYGIGYIYGILNLLLLGGKIPIALKKSSR